MTEAVRYIVGGVIIAIIILIISLVSTSLKKLASDEGMCTIYCYGYICRYPTSLEYFFKFLEKQGKITTKEYH